MIGHEMFDPNRKMWSCDVVFTQVAVEDSVIPIPLEAFKELVNKFERWAATQGLSVPTERRKLVWHLGWEYVEG